MDNPPILAIELGAADLNLIENWVSQGHLQNIARLLKEGASGQLENIDYYTTETKWTIFLTGCMPQTTGYWGPLKFHNGTYEMERTRQSYDFAKHPPFYTFAENARIAVFDLPQTVVSEKVQGVQVLGWGCHAPYVVNNSHPPELLPDLTSKFGEHPTFRSDFIDNWWNPETVTKFHNDLKVGIDRRLNICQFLLERQDWDLFLTGFSETHPAGHHYYHLSQSDHPLYPYKEQCGAVGDLMLDLYESADRAIGEIVEAAPENALVLLYSLQGMTNNSTDLPSMVFLPELLYRYSFPGKVALAPGRDEPLPPPIVPSLESQSWASEVWKLKCDRHPIQRFFRGRVSDEFQQVLDRWFRSSTSPDLDSPFELYKEKSLYAWQPTMWYKPFWSQMKAFALPTFAVEGFVRINLKGREPGGIVEPDCYHQVCDEITQHLYDLKDARSGKPIIKKVVRTRENPLDQDPGLPNADLVVVMADCPSDVVDSPAFGRIGPVPYHRTGGHPPQGFLIAKGPGIAPGSQLPEGHIVDLPPTILKLMGVPIPEYCEGKPLL
jgi:predicted AlkP superfamily phosphohydrolase/phosphomutase